MNTSTFDPCHTESLAGGCASCPSNTECFPEAELPTPEEVADQLIAIGIPMPVEVVLGDDTFTIDVVHGITMIGSPEDVADCRKVLEERDLL